MGGGGGMAADGTFILLQILNIQIVRSIAMHGAAGKTRQRGTFKKLGYCSPRGRLEAAEKRGGRAGNKEVANGTWSVVDGSTGRPV